VLHSLGFTPNSMSIFGLLLAVSSAFLYAFNATENCFIVLAGALFLLSGLSDVVDGLMADIYGETTRFGGVLDSVSDRYGDAVVLAGIIVGGLCDLYWGLIALIGSVMVSYVRARVEVEGVKMESVGLMERAERIILIFLASIINCYYAGTIYYSVILLALLTNFTVIQRMNYFRRATSTS
jgi:archaetidylinositol phosphate synthase